MTAQIEGPLTMLATPAPKQATSLEFETLTIEPDLARDLLARAASQRKLNPSLVQAFARDMRAGKWKLNGEPIILSNHGRLLAGRTRLAACLEAREPFRTLLVHNVDDAAFESIDALRKRTLGDILHIRRAPHGRALASALMILWRYANDDLVRQAKRPSMQELLEILDICPELQSVSLPHVLDTSPTLPLGGAIALHHLFSRVDQDRADEFFQALLEASTDRSSQNPVSVLKATLQELRGLGGRRHQAQMLALTIKAWNAFRDSKPVTVLRFAPERERFPSVSGLEDPRLLLRLAEAPSSQILSASDPNEELVAEYVMVTPSLAAELLQNNPDNRNIVRGVVDKYARDMASGHWWLNGQTIKIGKSGRLLDGQHRCQASIESGCSFPAILVRNVDDDAFDTFDLGPRKAFNAILSERGETYSIALASALRWVWLYEQHKLTERKATPTNAELEDVLERHPGIRDSLRYANRLRSVLAPGLGIALHYLFAGRDATLAEEFFTQLATGERIDGTRPVYHLREKLIRDRNSRKVRFLETERMALTIKAWNATREGRAVGGLAWRNRGPSKERFPDIC